MANSSKLDIEIGERIRECRLTAGYTQSNLAQLLEFDSPTAISLIENGERSLKIEHLITLVKLFKKDYKYFLESRTDSDSKTNKNDNENIEDLARRLLRVARNKKR
jgi:transcriptional regulator with XRE-family HTH domain